MDLREQLVRDEGLRLTPYRCPAGHWTLGVGRNLEARGLSVEEMVMLFEHHPICEADAMMLLDQDIAWTRQALSLRLPWSSELDPARQGALVNLAFNMGIGGLLGFRRMLQALRHRDYALAASELLASRYATQVGDRAGRVAAQIRSGQWV